MLVGGIVILLLCLQNLYGCTMNAGNRQPIYPIVHARELLLTAQKFPSGWQVNPCTVGCNRTERPTHSLRTFSQITIAGHVIQQVHVYEDAGTAHNQFLRLRDVEFTQQQPPNRSFTSPDSLQYQSHIADESAIACGKDVVEICKVFLRYRNYVIQFYFDIGPPEGVNVADIYPILKDMDSQIADTFHLTKP